MKLIFNGVSAAYQKNSIVEDISFTVMPGSITALIGRNGAGKSTLIHCLMGQKRDYTGMILLDGQDTRKHSPAQLAQRIAYLPQALPHPHVTVRELVGFGRTPYIPITGRLTQQDAEKIRWAIEAVGLNNLEDAFVDTLSGGERKKAFFAMTLAQDTDLVILDEPTAHLDTASRFELLALMQSLQQQTGKTFLVVMHELPEVLQCADRILALHDRTLIFDGTPEQCLASGFPESCLHIRITGNKEQGFAVTHAKLQQHIKEGPL